ncbi:(2Fe-2S)-binding protein [Paraburkholderia phenazinium]|nr:(2Fe-2S)-binding protein [Paraburkholderia phenazinium]
MPGTPYPPESSAERGPQFVRVAELQRAPLPFVLDGQAVSALRGDTVLTAILTQQRQLRHSEFSGEPRAGFCLIGACQDCWVRSEDGARLRACSTLLAEGMRIVTRSAALDASAALASTNSDGVTHAASADGVAP